MLLFASILKYNVYGCKIKTFQCEKKLNESINEQNIFCHISDAKIKNQNYLKITDVLMKFKTRLFCLSFSKSFPYQRFFL